MSPPVLCDTHEDALRELLCEVGLDAMMTGDMEREREAFKVCAAQEPLSMRTFEAFGVAVFALVLDVAQIMATLGLTSLEGCPVCAMNDDHEERCHDPRCEFTFEERMPAAAMTGRQTWYAVLRRDRAPVPT